MSPRLYEFGFFFAGLSIRISYPTRWEPLQLEGEYAQYFAILLIAFKAINTPARAIFRRIFIGKNFTSHQTSATSSPPPHSSAAHTPADHSCISDNPHPQSAGSNTACICR